MEYTFTEVMKQYNKCYNTNCKSFRFKDESELDEIIIDIFDLDEDVNIEVDYDNEKVIL